MRMRKREGRDGVKWRKRRRKKRKRKGGRGREGDSESERKGTTMKESRNFKFLMRGGWRGKGRKCCKLDPKIQV